LPGVLPFGSGASKRLKEVVVRGVTREAPGLTDHRLSQKNKKGRGKKLGRSQRIVIGGVRKFAGDTFEGASRIGRDRPRRGRN